MNHNFHKGDSVKVAGYEGVAFTVVGPEVLVNTLDDGELEEVEDWSVLRVRMIGDDRTQLVDADDCTPLAEGTYCADCGQLGCAHNVGG